MGTDGVEPVMRLPDGRNGDVKYLVHRPQDTMTTHAPGIGQSPQHTPLFAPSLVPPCPRHGPADTRLPRTIAGLCLFR